MSSDLLLGIGVAIIVMVILSLLSLRKYRSAWTGTVLSTCHIPGDDEGGQDQYKVTVRTDEGRTLSFDVVSQAMLGEFPVGTRVQKLPRQLFPTPLRPATPPPPPPPPPARSPLRVKALQCLLLALGLLCLATLPAQAHSDEGWTNPRQAGSGAGEARISGDDAQVTLNGDSLAAYGVIRSRNLSGDFELTVRIRLSTTRPRNGENRRAQLLLDSQEGGRSGRNQVYVGLVQRTAGRLAQTGGELRAITNLVVDGTGGRDSATFRLSRRGGEISTHIAEQGEWVQLSTWTGGFGDTVRVNFQVDNKWESSLPCPASGSVSYLSEASTENTDPGTARPAGSQDNPLEELANVANALDQLFNPNASRGSRPVRQAGGSLETPPSPACTS